METAVANTREFILSLIDAFDKNDVGQILSHMADDVEWHIVGNTKIAGKQGVEEFFKAFPDAQMITSTKDHIVIQGNTAVVNGEVQCGDPSSGVENDMYYCDIYDLEDGKVKKLTTYCVNKKTAEPEATK